MKRLLVLVALLFITSSPGYAQTVLGSSASATNPERSGDATTGFFSPAADTVAASSGGTEMMRVNGTGVGIGTTSPNASLVLNANTSGGPPVPAYAGDLLSIVGKDTATTGMDIFGYGAAPTLIMHRINGTNGSPTATGASLGLFVIDGEGYDGSAYTGVATSILGLADSAFTTSNYATDIAFKTTPTGSTTPAVGMELYQNGGLSIGTSYASTTPPTNGLIVVGDVGIGTTSPGSQLDIYGATGSIEILDRPAGQYSYLDFTTSGVRRWNLGNSNGAETGSNAGSDFFINRATDAGAYIDTPFSIQRSTGNISLGNTPTMYVEDSGNVGIGTTSPDSLLEVSNNAAGAPGTLLSGTVLHVMGANSTNARIVIDAFGEVNGSNLALRSAEGTAASPSASNSGDLLGVMSGYGYGATGYTSIGRGKIEFLADQNWTDTAQGADIIFLTTADGTTTTSEAMRITASGYLGIGTTSPAGTLDVEGGTAAASTNGSPITLVAQNAGTGNQNGGNIILTPGAATGTGTPGSVGIGTTSPTTALTVVGSGANNGVTVKGNGTILSLYNVDNTAALAVNVWQSGGGTRFYESENGGSTWNNPMNFLNGNVGIGTNSPSYPLDATGSIRTTQALLNSSAVPTISSCGTSPPAATTGSNNNSGQFTFGTGSPTACTVTFANAFPNYAFCTVTPTSNYPGTYRISSTAGNKSLFTVTLGTGTSSATFDYTCGGN